MSGPYLERGESIVLTTDRVSIDNEVYEAMLTTRQLILIDSLHAGFEPSVILLISIRSVRSGKAATGEPVIIITLQVPGDEIPGTKIIIFLQEPLENRKHDRDLWVKKLIELSLSGRVERGATEELPAEKKVGMHPSVRRWTAPDITRPRPDNFPVQEAPRDVIVTMDEPEPAAPQEILPAIPMPAFNRQQSGDDPGPGESGESDVEGADTGTESSENRVAVREDHAVTGQDLFNAGDEDLPAAPAEPVNPETPALMPSHANIAETQGSLTASILAAVESLTGQREHPQHPAPGAGIPEGAGSEHPLIPVRRTSLLPEDMDELLVVEYGGEPATVPTQEPPAKLERLPVFDEIERRVRTSSHIPEILTELPTEEVPAITPVTEVPAVSEPEILMELPTEEVPATTPVTEIPVQSEPGIQPGLSEYSPDVMVQEPYGGEEKQVPVRGPEEPAPAGPSSVHPSTGPTSIRLFLIAGGAILVLLLIITAILILPGFNPQGSLPVTVAPASIPVTTTMPIPAITTGVIPETTPTVTPIISPAMIPHDGVWVRIVSAAYYTGQAGNPGDLQPVSGPGEKTVSMRQNDRLVQVSVGKQDYSSDELLVEIYTNGTLVASRSTITPMGTINLLIDPATGNPPGITPLKTNTTKTGTLEYF